MIFHVVLASLVGTAAGAVFSLLPALHIYNVAGMLLLAVVQGAWQPEPLLVAMGLLSALVAYGFLNTIPSVFFGVPDESTAFLVLPTSRCLLSGRGYEAAMVTGVGSLGGLVILAIFAPLALEMLPVTRRILGPHMGWILLSVGAYMLVSEWPIGTDRPKNKLLRLWDSWDRLFFGILTFSLSGLLGMILLNRTLISNETAFQGVMPAFVGLFAVPWLIQNLLSRHKVPHQFLPDSLDVPPKQFVLAMGSGAVGGLFSATFPIVTAGVGSLFAGHATAQHDDRIFMMGYGATKVLYYAGAFLFFFSPSLNLARGGMASLMGPFYQPATPAEYWMALGVVLFSGGLSLLLLDLLSRIAARNVDRVETRSLNWFAMCVTLFLVGFMTGRAGLGICLVASGIGSIPIFFNCRRSHCMAILIVPIGLSMCGYHGRILDLLGL